MTEDNIPAPETPSSENDQPVDLSGLADFSFGPDWASDSSAHTTYSGRDPSSASSERGDRPRSRFSSDRGSRREGGRSFDRPRGPRGDRPPRGDRRDDAGRPPRFSREDRADRGPRDPSAPRPAFRKDDRGDRRGPRGPRPPRERMAVDIAFLPDRERLMLVVRDIQASLRAFPLMDIAARFLEHEDSHFLKLELPKPKAEGEVRKTFFQCRECKRVFTTRANAEAHILAAHLDIFFATEEVDVEPPSGVFSCVARCGFSGELLGPPNFHGYNERINELWSTRFSHIPKADYLARIETLRDDALLEQWKQAMSRKTVYRLKLAAPAEAPAAVAEPAPAAEETPADAAAEVAPEAPAEAPAEAAAPAPAEAAPAAPALGEPMDKAAAQDWMRANQLARLIRESPRCMVPGTQARHWDDPTLRASVDSARYREKQFAFSLSLALRPAFRHMRLHLFKINARETYVTAIQPVAFDEASATDLDKEIVAFLRATETPATRKTLLEAMRPGLAPESEEASEVLRHLQDLVAHGVIAELHTGTLFVPHLHAPAKDAGAPAEAPAEPAAEAPAAEVSAEAPAEPEAPAAEPVVAEAPAPEAPAEPAPEA